MLVAPLFRFPEEDVLLQRDTAAASLDFAERAELCGKEMRSDMAAFKAAQPGETSPSFSDFVYWRRSPECFVTILMVKALKMI